MPFVYTTAIKKLRKLKKRKRVVPGGTSAGKTFGIIPILIDLAAKNEGLEISVVSETIPHLRKGALKDFLKIMKETGRYIDAHYNRTLLTYTFSTGSFIEFFSADQEGKVRGPRRNILYINECNNINFETYHQLAIRTSGEIWLDFNPSNEFWVHTELKDDPDAEWLTLTYKDNEALSPTIVAEIEKARDKAATSEYWANWWKVYGLGQLGSLQGVVFDNWAIIPELPKDLRGNLIPKMTGYGLDFGYTNDPTAAIVKYVMDGITIYDEIIYQKGLKNGDIARLLKQNGITKQDYGWSESSEPKSIDEINLYGFTLKPVEKGEDSVRYGIQLMQQQRFLVTARSTNLINELRKYIWDTDKTGASLQRPIDAFNHAIDAARYIEMMEARKPKGNYNLRF
jgi:phage terminase large subunit